MPRYKVFVLPRYNTASVESKPWEGRKGREEGRQSGLFCLLKELVEFFHVKTFPVPSENAVLSESEFAGAGSMPIWIKFT